jgi:hypothetical protein
MSLSRAVPNIIPTTGDNGNIKTLLASRAPPLNFFQIRKKSIALFQNP